MHRWSRSAYSVPPPVVPGTLPDARHGEDEHDAERQVWQLLPHYNKEDHLPAMLTHPRQSVCPTWPSEHDSSGDDATQATSNEVASLAQTRVRTTVLRDLLDLLRPDTSTALHAVDAVADTTQTHDPPARRPVAHQGLK